MTFVINLIPRKACWIAITLIMAGLLTGCAGLPSEATTHSEFSGLGDADASLSYNTAFPIASAKEAVLKGDAAVAKGDLNRALFEYIRALEKEGRHVVAQCLFDQSRRDARKIGRNRLLRVAEEGVAGKVVNDCEGVPVEVVDAQNADLRIDGPHGLVG